MGSKVPWQDNEFIDVVYVRLCFEMEGVIDELAWDYADETLVDILCPSEHVRGPWGNNSYLVEYDEDFQEKYRTAMATWRMMSRAFPEIQAAGIPAQGNATLGSEEP